MTHDPFNLTPESLIACYRETLLEHIQQGIDTAARTRDNAFKQKNETLQREMLSFASGSKAAYQGIKKIIENGLIDVTLERSIASAKASEPRSIEETLRLLNKNNTPPPEKTP